MQEFMHAVRKEDLPLIGSSYNFVGAEHGDVAISIFLVEAQPRAWRASTFSRIRRDRARAGRRVAIRDRRLDPRGSSGRHSRGKSRNSAWVHQRGFGNPQATRHSRQSAIPARTRRTNGGVSQGGPSRTVKKVGRSSEALFSAGRPRCSVDQKVAGWNLRRLWLSTPSARPAGLT
jgi:hypothetical protein